MHPRRQAGSPFDVTERHSTGFCGWTMYCRTILIALLRCGAIASRPDDLRCLLVLFSDKQLDELDCLVSLRSHRLALSRVKPSLRLRYTRKLCKGETLRCLADHSGCFVALEDRGGSSLRNRLPDRRIPGIQRGVIEDLGFADKVHLLGLGVKALDCCGTESSTRDH